MIAHYAGQYREICDVFHDAVHATASVLYTPEQVAAWAPGIRDYQHWHWRCELKRPFVDLNEHRVTAFIELDPDGHIDCHYTRPEWNRQGIGGRLLRHALTIAEHLKLPKVFVEASHLAKGLYLKHGFTVVRENEIVRRGVTLSNWIMERQIAGKLA
ncbi:acetyltransferase [Planctomycetota bacterium]|nr:acetyltransferase [Planctomycetota bacterium]